MLGSYLRLGLVDGLDASSQRQLPRTTQLPSLSEGLASQLASLFNLLRSLADRIPPIAPPSLSPPKPFLKHPPRLSCSRLVIRPLVRSLAFSRHLLLYSSCQVTTYPPASPSLSLATALQHASSSSSSIEQSAYMPPPLKTLGTELCGLQPTSRELPPCTTLVWRRHPVQLLRLGAPSLSLSWRRGLLRTRDARSWSGSLPLRTLLRWPSTSRPSSPWLSRLGTIKRPSQGSVHRPLEAGGVQSFGAGATRSKSPSREPIPSLPRAIRETGWCPFTLLDAIG